MAAAVRDHDPAILQAIERLVQHSRDGRGAPGLFVGLDGTGKTMAADALARASGLGVLRVDLRDIVSKYIGETEKNLDRLFARAEAQDTVLFFDEADALFGKRTDVRDAHDRHANQEVAFLLRRIEESGRPAILASNQRPHIDASILERFRVLWPPDSAT